PDFRSVGGLYTSGPYAGYSPEQILSNKFFRESKNKPIFFQFYKERIMRICDKEPNRAHLALKKLEDMGKLKAIVTQNIDNLHNKAGNS
ncbi:Sir2 family NAD-dependent protein deacetylase, partial [Streptococcus pseudopneumoniae]|uniref:Sir2 family NAD-dependent protein deacetylase n=1 Tax=Streptococcus pseudopneumoniae TaxID=257758 RepID=UPI00249F3FF4